MALKKKKAVKAGARRPLDTRGAAWAHALAGLLTRAKLAPNGISVAGLGFALLGSALLALGPGGPRPGLSLVLAAICVQLRLLCNLMDGMVAIEGGLKSKTGDIYNEVPDRLADIALLVGAGWSLPGGPMLGMAAALAALLTAYVRLFGASVGLKQDFRGPQSKPQRMFVLTLACLAGATPWAAAPDALRWGLIAIVIGSIATFVRRLWSIHETLRNA